MLLIQRRMKNTKKHAMQTLAVLAVRWRSQELKTYAHGRTIAYVSNTQNTWGDFKGFEAAFASKSYGDTVNMEKLECVSHVQKRLGTRLRT